MGVQEMPFINQSNIYYYMTHRMDAYHFLNILDTIFQVNTYVFTKDENEFMVIPRHQQNFLKFAFPNRPIQILFQHNVVKYPPEFSYELVGIVNNEQGLNTLLEPKYRDIFEKIFNTYYTQYIVDLKTSENPYTKYTSQDYPETTNIVGQYINFFGKVCAHKMDDGSVKLIEPTPPLFTFPTPINPNGIPILNTTIADETPLNFDVLQDKCKQLLDACIMYYSFILRKNPQVTPLDFLEEFTIVDTERSTYPVSEILNFDTSTSYTSINNKIYIRIPTIETRQRLLYNIKMMPLYNLKNFYKRYNFKISYPLSSGIMLYNMSSYIYFIFSYYRYPSKSHDNIVDKTPQYARSEIQETLTESTNIYPTTRFVHNDDKFLINTNIETSYKDEAVKSWMDDRKVLGLSYNTLNKNVTDIDNISVVNPPL